METVHGRGGAVTAPHALASEAGLDVLRHGGDAIEAAVAVAAALAVVYPHANGIGGDSFWLIAEPGRAPVAIDASGRAALAADLALYRRAGVGAIPMRGPLAANTVAGTLSGWQAALALSGGRTPLARLLERAIHHAEHGFPVAVNTVQMIAGKRAELEPVSGFAESFLVDGASPALGQPLRQPALARTLRRLATEGLDSAYRGSIARDIAADLAAAGSPLSLADLEAHQAWTGAPLSTDIAAGRLYNTPPPTQGLASLMILALFERLQVEQAEGFDHVHGLIEATKQAFRVRDRHVGDPRFMEIDPQALLDDRAGLDRLAAGIDRGRASAYPGRGPGDTVWFGVIDGEGRAVSAIQSIYTEFGSGVVLPQTGIVWQNRGSSFRLAEDGWNALRPRRKPFHTLNPAMARLRDGRMIAYGTMGGEGQPQTQAAFFTRHVLFGQDLQAAISAPRWLLGRAWGLGRPGEADIATLKMECRFEPALIRRLEAAGHDVEIVGPFENMMGHAGALVLGPGGALQAATDPRSDGAALVVGSCA